MNDEQFNDPLADFDPVMESALSVNEEQPISSEPATNDALNIPATDSMQAPEPEAIPQNDPVINTPDDQIDLSKDESFFDNDESFDIDESLFEENDNEDGISVAKVNFDAPSPTTGDGQVYDKNLFKNIKVDVSIELGRSQISLKKLYELKNGSIIELGRLVGEPLDLVINDQVIARGEVVAVNSNYGIRITHVESLANIA